MERREQITVIALVFLMLFTGTVNTIATKYQDIVCVEYDDDGVTCKRRFKHFVVQSAEMFLGEILCLLPALVGVIYRWLKNNFGSPKAPKVGVSWRTMGMAAASFAVPAFCDISGTTMLNVGIFYTYPSVYQMLRGTVVFFAGIFTIVLLGRQLSKDQWLALFLIVIGAGIVGSVSVLPIGSKHNNGKVIGASNPLLGNILVICAQLAAAFQFIIEEKYLSRYKVPPNVAVGLEGFWGFLTTMTALPLLAKIKDAQGQPFDDLPQAIHEIKQNRTLMIATLGSIFSIAFFNFFGITLTKRLSGAARATIDACRTIFVWIYSVNVGWEEKSWVKNMLQIFGFMVLVSGTSLFNGLLTSRKKKKMQEAKDNQLGEETPLITSPSPGMSLQFNRKYISNTMARSFRLGRSLFSSPSSSFTDMDKGDANSNEEPLLTAGSVDSAAFADDMVSGEMDLQ